MNAWRRKVRLRFAWSVNSRGRGKRRTRIVWWLATGSGNCRNCAEWFTHQDRRGRTVRGCLRARGVTHTIFRARTRAQAAASASASARDFGNNCRQFSPLDSRPAIDVRIRLDGCTNFAAESMRSSSLNRSSLNDWSNFFFLSSFYWTSTCTQVHEWRERGRESTMLTFFFFSYLRGTRPFAFPSHVLAITC